MSIQTFIATYRISPLFHASCFCSFFYWGFSVAQHAMEVVVVFALGVFVLIVSHLLH